MTSPHAGRSSASCVTGLSLMDIGRQLTLFGQLVIIELVDRPDSVGAERIEEEKAKRSRGLFGRARKAVSGVVGSSDD